MEVLIVIILLALGLWGIVAILNMITKGLEWMNQGLEKFNKKQEANALWGKMSQPTDRAKSDEKAQWKWWKTYAILALCFVFLLSLSTKSESEWQQEKFQAIAEQNEKQKKARAKKKRDIESQLKRVEQDKEKILYALKRMSSLNSKYNYSRDMSEALSMSKHWSFTQADLDELLDLRKVFCQQIGSHSRGYKPAEEFRYLLKKRPDVCYHTDLIGVYSYPHPR